MAPELILNSPKRLTKLSYSKLQQTFKREIVSCDLCHGRDFEIIQKYGRIAEPGVYGDLTISCCKTCGLTVQNPRYPDEFYKTYYEEMYRKVAFGDLVPSDEYVAQQKERGRNVRVWVEKAGVPKGKLLDHGCASGGTMVDWNQNGWKSVGIDPHKPSVDIGIKMGHDIRLADGELLPFKDKRFTCIISLGSLEHCYNLGSAMREIHRVLCKNGHLFIRWRSNKIFGSPIEYYNHNHYRFFTPETLEKTVNIFGFKVLATTNQKLEGWDSYSYLLCEKLDVDIPLDIQPVSPEYVQNEKEHLIELRHIYYNKCKKFLEIYIRLGKDTRATYDFVKSKKQDFEWGLLGGDPESVVLRSVKEAEWYIKEFEMNRVI